MTKEEVVEAVLKLWDDQGGWIPGALYQELAAALGVPEERLLEARQSQVRREQLAGWGEL